MPNDLTTSAIDRQNVLNNKYALEKIEAHLSLGGIEFEGDTLFTKQQLTELYEVSDTTVERYVKNHADELKANGYQLLKGKKLNEYKRIAHGVFIDEGSKISVIVRYKFSKLPMVKWR